MAPAEAPTLIFAHYFGGSGRSWGPLLNALDGDLPCRAPDLPGFGGEPLSSGDPDLHGYAVWMERLADGRDWIAVGHSMGGKIAMAAAVRGAVNLRGLILIAPSPPSPEPMSEEERQRTILAYGDRTAARIHIGQITDHTLAPDLFAQCVEDEVAAEKPAWLWWLEIGSRMDISSEVAALDLPVLIIAGDNDKVLGLETAIEVARNLPGAELRIVGDGGHLVPLEQPEVVAISIRRFVDDLTKRSA